MENNYHDDEEISIEAKDSQDEDELEKSMASMPNPLSLVDPSMAVYRQLN